MRIDQRIRNVSQDNNDKKALGGIIGRVIDYHPPVGTDSKPGKCRCSRHNGDYMEIFERHSVDVEIISEKKKEYLYAVPCLMYAQGIIDQGFVRDDKVFISFVGGDRNHPVAIAYYRPPNKIDFFWNNLKYSMSTYVSDFIRGEATFDTKIRDPYDYDPDEKDSDSSSNDKEESKDKGEDFDLETKE